MRYAIVESGGKQFRAVEGGTIEVDRLPVEAGKQFDLERALFMGDGDEVLIGTPIVSGIQVKATVLAHIKGPKVISFKYRPKKRIRVKGGHRQQYTRLMVDFIGRPGEKRIVEKKVEEPVAEKEVEVKTPAKKTSKVEKPVKAAKEAATKSTAKKAAPAKKSTAKSPAKKSTTTKKTTKK